MINEKMNKKETKKMNNWLDLISEEEKREIERVCGPDFDYWDIPAYIRKRNKEIREDMRL